MQNCANSWRKKLALWFSFIQRIFIFLLMFTRQKIRKAEENNDISSIYHRKKKVCIYSIV